MAYLGRRGALAPVSTADIPDNSITSAKIVDNAVTLAKTAGGTDGQIITYDASGDPVAVGPGTDGQVLTSTGAGSPPAFEAVEGGATSGMVSNVWKWKDTSSGACSISVTTITVATDAKSFSATSGRHYIISGMQVAQPHRSGNTSMEEKMQKQYLYYGTTDRSILDTTVDTQLFFGELGIDHNANSNRTAASAHIFTYVGSFTAASTATHYVYTAIASLAAGDIQARAYNNATYPHHTVVMEVMP
tara:strand:+ start:339 stop:1076 length:738 start_codon:yes stop_codon:yes gene_type:complete